MATRIWNASTEAFFAQASVPALLLVLVSAVAVWLILSQEERKASR
jgi:ABC-type Fe3+ transport system permease subunit